MAAQMERQVEAWRQSVLLNDKLLFTTSKDSSVSSFQFLILLTAFLKICYEYSHERDKQYSVLHTKYLTGLLLSVVDNFLRKLAMNDIIPWFLY